MRRKAARYAEYIANDKVSIDSDVYLQNRDYRSQSKVIQGQYKMYGADLCV